MEIRLINTSVVVGLLLGALVVAAPAQAKKRKTVNPMASVSHVYITMKASSEHMISLCRLTLVQQLEKKAFSVVKDRGRADAELVFSGTQVTIIQGRSGDIGRAQLSYGVEVVDASGRRLWSMVDHEWGKSLAGACDGMAEEVAKGMADARDD